MEIENIKHILGLVLLLPFLGLIFLFFSRLKAWRSGIWGRERDLACFHPFPMRGRVDEVRWEKNGSLTVAELKKRKIPKVFKSDIVQLSCYAMMLRKKSFLRVNSHGIVMLEDDNGRIREFKVNLIDENVLIRIYKRWDSITDGNEIPRKCDNMAYCKYCGFKGRECGSV